MATETSRFHFPIWNGTDPFQRADFNDIHQQIEDLAAMVYVENQSPDAANAAATADEYMGAFWYDQSANRLYFSDGVAWRATIVYNSTNGNIVPVAISDTSLAGSSEISARADHRHAGPGFGTPVSVGTANADGSATTVAKSDHVHALGSNAVTTASIAANSVTAAKLNNDVAGSGIGRDVDGSLKVNVGSGSLHQSLDYTGDTVIVKEEGLTQRHGATSVGTAKHRFIRTGSQPTTSSLADITTGDIWVDAQTNLTTRTGGDEWLRPRNLPWGIVAKTEILTTGTQTIAGGDPASPTAVTIASTALSVTATLRTDRLYRIRGFIPSVAHDVSSLRTIIMYLRGNGATYQRSLLRFEQSGLGQSMGVERIIAGLNTGSQTWSVALSFDATQFGNITASVYSLLDAATITIEDVGPA